MVLSLAEIRARLMDQQAKKDRGKTGTGGDSATYPFWNNPEGSTATIRFLEDGDSSNDYFWVERLIIKLPFNSIKGQPHTGKPVEVQVPCVDMWKPNSCPINAESRPWWKGGKDLEEMARKYWRKKSFLFQGFVRTNPNVEDAANAPENPIRRFMINPSVFDRIKTVFMDQEIENSPVGHTTGLDFRLVKGTKGQYADYGQSAWARRESALTDEEQAAIAKHGLFNLSNFLPKKPDEAHLQAIVDMFHDSVDDKPYDPDKYAQFYKPYGLKTDDTDTAGNDRTVQSSKPAVNIPTRNINIQAPRAQVEDAPFDGGTTVRAEAPADTGKKLTSPEDILAAIRKRTAAKA